MGIKTVRFMKVATLSVAGAALVGVGVPARAQSTASARGSVSAEVQANNSSRPDVAQLREFLDGHPEVAESLRTNPSLLDNKDFVKHHSDLKKFLRDNRDVRNDARQDPTALMQEVDQFGRTRGVRDQGREARDFHEFLDSHPEISEQVRKDPSLLDNRAFVKNHPALQGFYQDHAGVRNDVAQDPDAFMHRGDNFDRDFYSNDRDVRDRSLAEFRRFSDSHREIADQLRKDPGLINSRDFVNGYPDLRNFLRDHPELTAQMRQNPNAFMQQADRFNSGQADERGFDRGRRAEEFRRFLDDHPEIAEQVRRDHSLAVNQQFIDNHPELKGFYQANPDVRDRVRQDPDAFMQREDGFARVDNRSFDRDHLASFHDFLGGHSDVARDMSHDPTVVKNPDYLQNHPELNNYLKANPGVRDDLMQHPQSFVKGTQQVGVQTGANGVSATGSGSISGSTGAGTTGTSGTTKTTGTSGTTASPTYEPKAKH
jgi:hypothetical protein